MFSDPSKKLLFLSNFIFWKFLPSQRSINPVWKYSVRYLEFRVAASNVVKNIFDNCLETEPLFFKKQRSCLFYPREGWYVLKVRNVLKIRVNPFDKTKYFDTLHFSVLYSIHLFQSILVLWRWYTCLCFFTERLYSWPVFYSDFFRERMFICVLIWTKRKIILEHDEYIWNERKPFQKWADIIYSALQKHFFKCLFLKLRAK